MFKFYTYSESGFDTIVRVQAEDIDAAWEAFRVDFPNSPVDFVTEDGEGDYDESMDGDFDSAMASAGFGTDEDYGYYGD